MGKESNCYIETKESSDTLIIAFTGIGGELGISHFDFYKVTSLYEYNRILIRDPSRKLCLGGIHDDHANFEAFLEDLKSEISFIKPKKLIRL